MKKLKKRQVLQSEYVDNTFALHFLEERAKEGDLGELQKRTLDYLHKAAKIKDLNRARELMEKIKSVTPLPQYVLVQIVNILPETEEELKVILQPAKSQRVVLSEDEIKRILEIIREYSS